MQKNFGFSTASLLLGVSVCCLKSLVYQDKIVDLGAKLGYLLKSTKKMHNFFTYIIVIFSEIQYNSTKMNNYNYFNQLTVFVGEI